MTAVTREDREAALRETLETLLYWHDQGHIDESWWDAARALLSPSPAQGGAAVPAVFGVGDVVRVTGDTAKAEHEFAPGTEGQITDTRCDEDYDLVLVTPLGAEAWWVHPRDLALVRKAGA